MSVCVRVSNFFTRSLNWIRENPLCSLKLESGVKAIAIIQMILSCLALLAIIPICQAHLKLGISCWEMAVIIILGAGSDFILYAFLYWKGVKNGNYTVVNRCWIVMVVWAIGDVLLTIIVSIYVNQFVGLELIEVIFDVIYIYSVFVVYCYKEELQRIGQTHASQDSAGDFVRFV